MTFAGAAYLSLDAGEVAARAEMALRLLGPDRCTVCPRLCKVNRLADQRGLCAVGRQAIVASHFPHFGEENWRSTTRPGRVPRAIAGRMPGCGGPAV